MESNSIRMVAVLCVLLLCMCCITCSVAENVTCAHSWTIITDYSTAFQGKETVVRQYDAQSHIIMYDMPTEVCSLCGETRGQGYGAGFTQIHSYKVKKWHFINEGSDVEIVFCCHICAYEFSETIALQEILDGSNELCILGGECAAEYVGSMYPEGIVQTSGFRTDAISFSGIVVVPCVENQCHYYLAERNYCPVCGRPRMQIFSILDEALMGKWEKWPCYDLPTFLSYDMPDELPYQLIDRLRSQLTDP